MKKLVLTVLMAGVAVFMVSCSDSEGDVEKPGSDEDITLFDEDSQVVDENPISDEVVDGEREDSIPDEDAVNPGKFPFPIEGVKPEWKKCALYENLEQEIYKENSPGWFNPDEEAECADLLMPLFWNDDERTVNVRVKRVLSREENADAQLWFLHGGPGAAGSVSLSIRMKLMQEFSPGTDMYAIDHRGTGYSEELVCPEMESEGSQGGDYITAQDFHRERIFSTQV